MGLQEARMKSRACALVQYDWCPYNRRDKDTTTSRGRSCGLTVRRQPPTGQEERPRRKPPCRHSDLGLPHTQAGLSLPVSAQEPWAVGSTQAIPGSQLPPSCPDLNFGHAWVGLARAGALALHWVRMLWKAGCRCLEWAAGSLCLPTAPGGGSHLAGLLGVGWGSGCWPIAHRSDLLPGFLASPSHGVCSWQACL